MAYDLTYTLYLYIVERNRYLYKPHTEMKVLISIFSGFPLTNKH